MQKLRIIYYEIRKLTLLCLAVIFSPVFYYLISQRRKIFQKSNQLRILVIPQLTRVGDLVCATPVFRAIKKQYPNSYLAVLVTNKVAGIIKNNPRVDEIIIYKSIDFAGVLRKVRSGFFNWSFCLSGTAIGTLIAFWGLIPNRVKLTRQKHPLIEFLSDWLNNFKLLYKHHTYLPSHYLKLLSFIGIDNPEEIKEVFLTPQANQKVSEFLKNNGINEEDSLVGISITAGNKIKEWGDEKFKQLAEQIVKKYNAKIIFIGAKSDEERINAILQYLNSKVFFKSVDFSLEELPSLLKRLSLYIAVDTGPIYIAHALKIPLINVIGPVDPTEQPPEDERSILVRPNPAVAPSSFVFKKAGKPEEHQRALKNISIESVLSAVQKMVFRIKK